MATWPISLPQKFLVDGYNEAAPSNTIRTQMDIGPPKLRKRSTAAETKLSGQMYLTYSQVDTLLTFFSSTLDDGADTFDWTHPRTGAAIVARFAEPPNMSAQGLGFYVSIMLEVLP